MSVSPFHLSPTASTRPGAFRRAWLPILSSLFICLCHARPVEDSAATPPPDTLLDPRVEWRDTLPAGPFVSLADGRALAVDGTDVLTSHDEGRSWRRMPLFSEPEKYFARLERALLRTKDGTLLLAFLNDRERVWKWDQAQAEPGPDVRLPTFIVRSVDEGTTWEVPQRLQDEWSGAIRNMIQTHDGGIVFTTMKILRQPGRHGCLTYRSDDDGRSWRPSNLLDLGGHGHHDGALEPAIVELRSGQLWMLIRTTLDFLHEARSHDGLHWRELGPTTIDASTAPPMITRLASGRLLLVWNRLHREGETDHPRRGGDNQWSAVPAINQRAELSIAFSDDDGRTWTRPAVIVRSKRDTSYPYVYERRPGELWITTMRSTVKLVLHEADFVSTDNRVPTPPAEDQPLRIACVGDSITAGHGAGALGYPAQLAALVPGIWEVRSFARNGVTALRSTTRPAHAMPMLADAGRFGPDVVLLALGTNDAAAPASDRRHFTADYTNLILHFRSLLSQPRLIILTPPPLAAGRDEARRRHLAEEIVPSLRDLARIHRVELIDLHALPELDNPELYPDAVHPNAEGHRFIAAEVARHLRSAPTVR
jgi:sialidase-1